MSRVKLTQDNAVEQIQPYAVSCPTSVVCTFRD